MKNDKYQGGPVSVIVFLDQDKGNRLYGLNISTGNDKRAFASFCKEYIEECPVGQPIGSFVFEQYEFPDLDSVPNVPSEESEKQKYYSDCLKPAVDKLDLKPKYSLPMDELLYGIMHDKAVSVIENNDNLTSRPDFVSECAKYRQAAPDLSGRMLGMSFGDSAVIMRLENPMSGFLQRLAEVLQEPGPLSVRSIALPHSGGPKIS